MVSVEASVAYCVIRADSLINMQYSNTEFILQWSLIYSQTNLILIKTTFNNSNATNVKLMRILTFFSCCLYCSYQRIQYFFHVKISAVFR